MVADRSFVRRIVKQKPGHIVRALWSWKRDSNLRPADYESAALPTELLQRGALHLQRGYEYGLRRNEVDYLLFSSTATATATVAPTMGLLPMPMSPIIST